MAWEQLEQQGRGLAVSVLTLVAVWMYPSALALAEASGVNPGDRRIHQSAWIVVFAWPIASASLLLHRANRARYADSRFLVRLVYTAGLVAMLVHLAVAFHLGHGWSHADAFDRTERTSGFGPGIFVSYFFVLLWFVDAMWMWLAFDRYLNRSPWVNRSITGFMWFVLFNASVVYGSGPIRGLGALFLTAPWLVVYAMKIKEPPSWMVLPPPADRAPPLDEAPGRTP
jgi:hypothetical protein